MRRAGIRGSGGFFFFILGVMIHKRHEEEGARRQENTKFSLSLTRGAIFYDIHQINYTIDLH